MIHLQPSAYLMAAVLVLLFPADWLLAVVLASVIHELGHLLVIYATGGHADSITIGAFGAKIYTRFPQRWKEFLCAAAGPAASILLVSLCHTFPKLAFCAAIQGMFNLIPVYPMDGGRMLHCLLQWLCPRKSERVFRIAERTILCGLFVLALALMFRLKNGLLPVLVCAIVLSRLLLTKIPCKSV